MSADILQYVEKHVGNPMVCDHIIAEIVRLRGKVAPNVAGLVDSLIQLRDADWTLYNEPMPDDAQGVLNMAIEAIRNPAPAMPNGVEGLVAEWEALIAHPDTSTIMRTTLENVVTRLRAADNHDAAGGYNPAAEAIKFALTAEEGLAFLRAWNKGDFAECRMGWPEAPDTVYIGADPLIKTPAAVPAGEAVAVVFTNDGTSEAQFIADGERLNCPRCGGSGHVDDGPQPADGEAVASAWKTVHVLMSVMRFRPLTNAEQGELQDAHVTIRTAPPAPVQTAPQEGEQYAEGPTWTHNGQRISLVNGQLIISRNGKIEFIGTAHPPACELGVPPEMAIAASGIRSNGMYVKGWNDCREAALQHRGDSRGGEG